MPPSRFPALPYNDNNFYLSLCFLLCVRLYSNTSVYDVLCDLLLLSELSKETCLINISFFTLTTAARRVYSTCTIILYCMHIYICIIIFISVSVSLSVSVYMRFDIGHSHGVCVWHCVWEACESLCICAAFCGMLCNKPRGF